MHPGVMLHVLVFYVVQSNLMIINHEQKRIKGAALYNHALGS